MIEVHSVQCTRYTSYMTTIEVTQYECERNLELVRIPYYGDCNTKFPNFKEAIHQE